jgi:hypothetical protein
MRHDFDDTLSYKRRAMPEFLIRGRFRNNVDTEPGNLVALNKTSGWNQAAKSFERMYCSECISRYMYLLHRHNDRVQLCSYLLK